ncbi:MAG: EamA family transporter [Candidatus Diapherotrites archaeon]|nr:EamA family transporter [Candidatus Diapherotrites archaeon]
MVQAWLLFGILAAVFFGCHAIATKVAVSEKFFGLSPALVSLLALAGMGIVFIAGMLFEGVPELPKNSAGIAFAVFAGVLWGIGFLLTLKAFSIGAEAAKLAPIYNTNTLVAVFLGIVLLKELPTAGSAFTVVLGALLIVAGAFLVSL